MQASIAETLQSLLPEFTFRQATEKDEKSILDLLAQSTDFGQYSSVRLSEIAELIHNENHSFLCLINLEFIFKGIKCPQHVNYVFEQELIGIAVLRKDYGRVIIRPETLADKIAELFNSTEVDFADDQAFSSRYYVLAENESLFRFSVSSEFRKAIKKFNEIEIEIIGNILIARFKKPFSDESGSEIVNFMSEINNGYN